METMFAFWRKLARKGMTPVYPIGSSWEVAKWAVSSQFPSTKFPEIRRGITVSNFHTDLPYDDCRGFFRAQER